MDVVVTQLIERRGFETQQAAVEAAGPLLREGFVVRITPGGDSAPRPRKWKLEAWEAGVSEEAEPEPVPAAQNVGLIEPERGDVP